MGQSDAETPMTFAVIERDATRAVVEMSLTTIEGLKNALAVLCHGKVQVVHPDDFHSRIGLTYEEALSLLDALETTFADMWKGHPDYRPPTRLR